MPPTASRLRTHLHKIIVAFMTERFHVDRLVPQWKNLASTVNSRNWHISAGCIQKTPFLQGQSCKCKLCIYNRWQKYKSFFYRTLWRTKWVCSVSSIVRLLHQAVQQGYTRHRFPFQAFWLSFVFLIALPRKRMCPFLTLSCRSMPQNIFYREFGD